MAAILFYDGHCMLCSGLVQYLLKHSDAEDLVFSALQGETAAQELDEKLRQDLDTVVLKVDDRLYFRSTAALKSLAFCGAFWRLFSSLAMLLPSFLRDFFYRMIASNRYLLFGRRDQCHIPSEEEKLRFLL